MRDFDIRLALKETSLQRFYSDSSTIVEELTLPCTGARIDIAVVNGSFHGFEIKSASDTLNRLPTQLEGYSKIFDYLTVVTEEKHCKKIQKIIPDWVGLNYCTVQNNQFKMETVQKGKRNFGIESFYIAKLLRKDEIVEILKSNGIKFKSKDRTWLLCETLAAEMKTAEISKIVRAILKSRTEWKLFSKAGLRFL